MNKKRKISMMDPGPPGPPPKSTKSKGIAYVEPPEDLIGDFPRKRRTPEEKAALIEKLNSARRTDHIKVRLFDLVMRIESMRMRNVGRVADVRAEFSSNLQTTEFIRQPVCGGVLFTYPYLTEESDFQNERWEETSTAIRLDDDKSDDYKFDLVTKALDKLEAMHKEELEKQRKRDALLRSMTAEERALIGMERWRDPDPDGEAKALAAKVVNSRRSKK